MEILVAGGGIAGLGAALALSGPGRTVKVIDRDPPPPGGEMDAVFQDWDRKGATQIRHSHVFLAKLYNLIRDKYPKLLEMLFDAGAQELTFEDGLPSPLRAPYRPKPTDKDFSILSCRRTTLEAIMRRFAETQPGIAFYPGYAVRGIKLERGANGPPRADALLVETPGGKTEPWQADLIVDASGRLTQFPDWLAAENITPRTETESAGILYFTRHYRLNPGQSEPERGKSKFPGAGDLGFIKYGVFPADKGNFSITLALPEIETELRKRIVHGDLFDLICSTLPGIARWTAPQRAKPISKVFSMGNLQSVWRHWVENDQPLVLNFFAIGDATIRTNPLYGRGCSTGILHAHILADVLRATEDPIARAKFFHNRSFAEIRPFYDFMVEQDKVAIRAAENAQNPKHKAPLRSRLLRSFAQDAIVPASRGDIRVLRALVRGFHMIERPTDWMRRPDIMARVLTMWALPKPFKSHLYTGPLGPKREEMLELTAPNP